MQAIREKYNVPVKRGGRVKVNGKPGTIISFDDPWLKVRLDHDSITCMVHPQPSIVYEEERDITAIDSFMCAVQTLLSCHDEPGMAVDVLINSGFSRKEMLASQRRTGFMSDVMCPLIREATQHEEG